MSRPTFAELGVSSAVADALATRGITTPFEVQSLVIGDVLAGRDVHVKSPTGSGKTLAFMAPIADRIEATDPRPSALVVTPTRELAGQIVEEARGLCHARALSIAAVYGGVGFEKQTRLARRSHVLVATPGRLLDLMERGAISLRDVRLLVLDEADRMLDMGFRPAVDRIVRATPEDRQTLFFSATLDGEAARIAHAYTRDARRHEHRATPEQRGDVEHRFVRVAHEDKVDALLSRVGDPAGRTLVFVRTKRGADRLAKRLGQRGVDAAAIHGNRSQGQRERALARFRSGELRTLVATDVAARGIDVADIAHVINFDAPPDREGYVHRIGRTGRAGRTGVGTTFVLGDQARDTRAIAHALRLHDEFARAGFGEEAAPGPGRDARRGAPRRGHSGRRPRAGAGAGGR